MDPRLRSDAREPGLAAANERLLVRLGFDLHDGPLQQVYALAQDVRLLREQMVELVGSEHRKKLVGRFDDLDSQLAELHQDLRDLAHSLEPRSLLQQPLPQAVERELAALKRRTGISTSVVFEGSLRRTHRLPEDRAPARPARGAEQRQPPQRQPRGRRDPARRRPSKVSAWRSVTTAAASIPPASCRPRTERAGSGLVGMRERLRLLGGRLEIESAPGGPTTVRATLPRWLPLAQSA